MNVGEEIAPMTWTKADSSLRPDRFELARPKQMRRGLTTNDLDVRGIPGCRRLHTQGAADAAGAPQQVARRSLDLHSDGPQTIFGQDDNHVMTAVNAQMQILAPNRQERAVVPLL